MRLKLSGGCDFDSTPLGAAVNPRNGRTGVAQRRGLRLDLVPAMLKSLAIE